MDTMVRRISVNIFVGKEECCSCRFLEMPVSSIRPYDDNSGYCSLFKTQISTRTTYLVREATRKDYLRTRECIRNESK